MIRKLILLLAVLPALTFAQEKRLLWPDGAPGAKGDAEHDQPAMYVYKPILSKTNGCGVIVFPGGGYGGLAADHEGHQIGRFFNEFGVTAFVVHYRLGSKGYHHPTQLNDAKRAIRIVRHDAEKYRLDPDRIGTMGFSAGGHLCSMTGTIFDHGQPDAEDPIDRPSSRPNFIIPCYPVISMSTEYSHGGSRRNLLGGDFAPDSDEAKAVSTELLVKPDTPPAFIFQTDADKPVPAENCVLFYLALRKQGIPAEMHIYQNGPHGVGLMQGDPILGTWGGHLRDWMRSNSFLGKSERADVSGEVTLNGKPVSWGSITFTP
ncbi:MAG: alpha/beta hydrolase, partial [Verrucomicrobiota bacterium]